MSPAEIGAFLAVGVAIGGLLVRVYEKRASRTADNANAVKLTAEAKKTAQETAAGEVGYLREIIAEVRASANEKSDEVTAIKADLVLMKQRIGLLEERERHMLTRAAVHEAWDTLALQTLLTMNPNHPPPPPLALRPGDD